MRSKEIVESFLSKRDALETEFDCLIDINNEDEIKEGLREERIDQLWFSPGEIAEITYNFDYPIKIILDGKVKAKLIKLNDDGSRGEIIKEYSEKLIPDDTFLKTDADLKEIIEGAEAGVSDIELVFDEKPRLKAVNNAGLEHSLDEGSLARGLFQVGKLKDFATKESKSEKKKPKKKEESSMKEDNVKELENCPVKDSGKRTEFETGAVRDVQTGKGRCDLLPIDVLKSFYDDDSEISSILNDISLFEETGSEKHLEAAAKTFSIKYFGSVENGILEYAMLMEDGAVKYGDRNWEKGIPLERYVDSGIRHLMKFLRGDDDERHDRAFVWNMMCGAWTVKHHPELNGFRK